MERRRLAAAATASALLLGCAGTTPSVSFAPAEGSDAVACDRDPRAPAARETARSLLPPRVEGAVTLRSLRGDDRLRTAGGRLDRFGEGGATVVTATADALFVWDAASGEARHRVPLPLAGEVSSLAVSPDGSRVAVAAQRVVNRHGATRSQLVVVRPSEGTVRHVDRAAPRRLRFTTDGSRLIGDAQLWDVATTERLWGKGAPSGAQLFGRQGVLQDAPSAPGEARAFVHWQADGASALEVRREGHGIAIWRFEPDGSRQALARWPGETGAAGAATAFALSPNGKFFLVAQGGEGWLWALDDGAMRRVEVPGELEGVALSNDGTKLAHWRWPRVELQDGDASPAGDAPVDMRMRLWSLEEGRELWAVDHDGSRMFFSADDGLLLHDLRTKLSEKVVDVERGRVIRTGGRLLAIHAPSRRALVAGPVRSPRVVSLSEAGGPPVGSTGERVVARATGSEARVTLAGDERYRLRSISRCLLLPELRVPTAEPHPVRFSADGERVFGVRRDGSGTSVVAWDARDGRALGGVVADVRWHELHVLPRSAEVVVQAGDDLVIVGIVDRSRHSTSVPQHDWGHEVPHDGEVWPVRASSGEPDELSAPTWALSTRDGRYLLVPQTLGRKRHLSLWSTTGDEPIDLFQHDGLEAYALSPDDRLVAAAGTSSVRWWRLADQQYFGGPKLASRPERLRFSPDGRTLAVATREGLVHLVDIESEETIGTVDLRERFDRARLLTWADDRTLTIDTERGVEMVVALSPG